MRPLRIAVWHNLPSGGAKRVLQYHLNGLSARGHHIKIWHPPVPDSGFASLADAGEEREVPLAELPGTGIRYVDMFRHARRGQFDIQAMIAHSQRVAAEIQQEKWDFLFANTCRNFGAPYIGRYVPLRKLLYLQEPHRRLYEPLPRLPWLALSEEERRNWSPAGIRHRVRDRVDLKFARNRAREELLNAQAFDQILVNSLFSRESLLRAYGVDSRVCYLGIDTTLFRDLGLPRERLAVGVGTISLAKNVELAIRAIAAMPPPRPALRWIGNMRDPVYIEVIEELARSLDVDFQAIVMMSDDELVNILNRASAMIYAPRLEPFGLAPLEANACGCPVVAVAEGGMRETIEHGVNGFLGAGDPEELALSLSRLFDSPALVNEMGRAGRELVQSKWSVESSVDRLEDEIGRLLR